MTFACGFGNHLIPNVFFISKERWATWLKTHLHIAGEWVKPQAVNGENQPLLIDELVEFEK